MKDLIIDVGLNVVTLGCAKAAKAATGAYGAMKGVEIAKNTNRAH